MNYEIVNEIKNVLLKNDFTAEYNHINETIASGSTGSEITGMTTSYLLEIIKNNDELSRLIGMKVLKLRDYANSIGIYFE